MSMPLHLKIEGNFQMLDRFIMPLWFFVEISIFHYYICMDRQFNRKQKESALLCIFEKTISWYFDKKIYLLFEHRNKFDLLF